MEFISALLDSQFLGQPTSMWLVFLTVVTALLAFDLGVLNKRDHVIGAAESLRLAGIYISIALLFGVWVWWKLGTDDGMDYYTAYLIEQSLSIDNLFVMSLIFTYYGVPREYQHRVLFWGIVGVIVMRGIMIGVGAALVHNFEWVLLIFAAFLIFTGIKMMMSKDDDDEHIEDSRFIKFLQKHLKVTKFLHGHKFFIREKSIDNPGGGLRATPLLLALVTVEVADLLFAVDSVPAVLAITSNTFVVYTSNIFAVVGLRAMYFAVAAIIHRFIYMKYSLAIILVFIGFKAFYGHFFDKVPAFVSLGITLSLLAGGVIASMIKTSQKSNEADSAPSP
ncbi:MAG: TerC family protein [Micavibrio aeruginosavorus]|uniref:TerC family protein n=1 Tax=Micavibrio aeruginosavorus TaxID=349221 RepID=A0A7T5UHV7_9BACT|nr:MAG: TerC family protein [Micavibrio aeruginosavorus]